MMKIFALYTNFIITSKPEWLAPIMKDYNSGWEPHITLRQPCFIEDNKISKLKKVVDEFFTDHQATLHEIEISLDTVTTDEDDGIVTIMISPAKNQILIDLQKNLREHLNNYKNYVNPRSETWENDFNPHITIVRKLPIVKFDNIKKYIKKPFSIMGYIDKITLAVVNNISVDDARKPENLTNYNLK